MFFLQVLLVVLLTSTVFGQDKYGKIDNEYFVVLKDGLSDAEQNDCVAKLENDFDITLTKTFQLNSVRLLFVSGSEENVNDASELSEVDFVEQNAKVQADWDELPSYCHKMASPGTWGLDRIDQINKLPLPDVLNDAATYTLGPYRGADVVAYIIDTGIDVFHPDFERHAVWGYISRFAYEGSGDLNGHGTHVAGTVGSQSYGVAKEVLLKEVKVLNRYGSGSWAGVVDGMFWVWQQHNLRKGEGNVPKSVVNLSLGGYKNLCANMMVKLLHEAGIVVVAAAGNGYSDACYNSPGGSAPEAITVGASDINDKTASFTNWGTCVDIFAPGVDVLSTYKDHGKTVLSGTSMASPHVAGVVALKLSKEHMSPDQIAEWLTEEATSELTFLNSDHATSPNRLLFMDCLLDDISR